MFSCLFVHVRGGTYFFRMVGKTKVEGEDNAKVTGFNALICLSQRCDVLAARTHQHEDDSLGAVSGGYACTSLPKI